MQNALRVRTTVLPGHRIEVSAPDLQEGDTVEVIVLVPAQQAAMGPAPRQSMLEYLKSLAPQPRLFQTPAEADRYLQEERDSWDR